MSGFRLLTLLSAFEDTTVRVKKLIESGLRTSL